MQFSSTGGLQSTQSLKYFAERILLVRNMQSFFLKYININPHIWLTVLLPQCTDRSINQCRLNWCAQKLYSAWKGELSPSLVSLYFVESQASESNSIAEAQDKGKRIIRRKKWKNSSCKFSMLGSRVHNLSINLSWMLILNT